MSALAGLSAVEKSELVVALSALLVSDVGGKATPESINAVISASGNVVAPLWAEAFASTIAKAGGVDKFLKSPGEGKMLMFISTLYAIIVMNLCLQVAAAEVEVAVVAEQQQPLLRLLRRKRRSRRKRRRLTWVGAWTCSGVRVVAVGVVITELEEIFLAK